MDDDLEFVINALDIPNSPLRKALTPDMIEEMRDSYSEVLKILRYNRQVFGDGGSCGDMATTKQMIKTLAQDLRPVRAFIVQQFKANGCEVPNSRPVPECRPYMSAISYRTSETLMNGRSAGGVESNLNCEDTIEKELFFDALDSCLDLVPYVGDSTDYDEDDDDEFDLDPYEYDDTTLENPTSEITVEPSQSVSICIPLELKPLWNNGFYKPGTSESETTLRAFV